MIKISATENMVTVKGWQVRAGEYHTRSAAVDLSDAFGDCSTSVVVFRYASGSLFESSVQDGRCELPYFAAVQSVQVCVYGYAQGSSGLEIRVSPTPAQVPIYAGSYSDTDPDAPAVPTPGTYEELDAKKADRAELTSAVADLEERKANVSDLSEYLPLSGGKMSGDINMRAHRITFLLPPASSGEPVTKGYADDTYLEKKGNAYKLHGTGSGGAYREYGICKNPDGFEEGTIAQRGPEGTLYVPDPADEYSAVNQRAMNRGLSQRLEKTSTPYVLYGTDANGATREYSVSKLPSGFKNGTIPQRGPDGTIYVPDPSEPYGAVNKQTLERVISALPANSLQYFGLSARRHTLEINTNMPWANWEDMSVGSGVVSALFAVSGVSAHPAAWIDYTSSVSHSGYTSPEPVRKCMVGPGLLFVIYDHPLADQGETIEWSAEPDPDDPAPSDYDPYGYLSPAATWTVLSAHVFGVTN